MGDKVYIGDNKTCSLCHRDSVQVWGFVSTYNFYTAKTELAPLASGFNRKEAWKNYPVCENCALKLERAKQFNDRYLHYKFCGLDYYLIPEFLKVSEANNQILELFTDNGKSIGQMNMTRKHIVNVSSIEDEVFDLLSDLNNRANYSIFFFDAENAKFSILESIEGLFPTHFKALFNAKDRAEKHSVFKNIKGINEKGVAGTLEFTYSIVKDFFPIKSRIEGDYTEAFLKIVQSTFQQKQYDYDYLSHRIMSLIVSRFAKGEFIDHLVLKAFQIILFMQELKCIDFPTNKDQEVSLDTKYNDFFQEHASYFNSNAKKSVFLTGVLNEAASSSTVRSKLVFHAFKLLIY